MEPHQLWHIVKGTQMRLMRWDMLWPRNAEKVNKRKDEMARQEQERLVAAHKQVLDARRKTFSDEKEHLRKLVIDAISKRERFLYVTDHGYGHPYFWSAILSLANEEGSWILDIQRNSPGQQISALLKLAVAPKNAE